MRSRRLQVDAFLPGRSMGRMSHSRKGTMSENYQPGQLVRLARVGFSKFGASNNDLYEVLRLMPADQTGEVTKEFLRDSAAWYQNLNGTSASTC